MRRRRRRPRYLAEERILRDLARTLSGRRDHRARLIILVSIVALAVGGWWAWDHFNRRRFPVGPTVRIATWNLRHFSDRQTIDLRAVADIITSSRFDLVAIQEVKQDGAQIDRLLNVLGPPWRATRISEQTGNYERFAFVYHGERVQSLDEPRFIAGADTFIFDRTPYDGAFCAGQFDFRLISVHLSYSDITRRRREARTLARFVDKLQRSQGEKDIIVLGDFNEEGRGNLHFFEAGGWEVLNESPTNLSARRAYDTLIIDPSHTREWSGISGAIAFDETHFRGDDRRARETVSDHRPAYADFVISLPDDD